MLAVTILLTRIDRGAIMVTTSNRRHRDENTKCEYGFSDVDLHARSGLLTASPSELYWDEREKARLLREVYDEELFVTGSAFS